MSDPKVLNVPNDNFYGSTVSSSDYYQATPLLATSNAEQLPQQCNENAFRESFVTEAPLYCECARVSKRPLSWAFWSGLFSNNRSLDAVNAEFSHSHISFDQSGQNIGFGQEGLFAEDMSKSEYRQEPECYDGVAMRQVIAATKPPSGYKFLGQNCQVYVESVLKTLKQKLISAKE